MLKDYIINNLLANIAPNPEIYNTTDNVACKGTEVTKIPVVIIAAGNVQKESEMNNAYIILQPL